MRVSKGLQKLLANFVFRDSRLESHPKVLSSDVYFASGDSHLEVVARVSKDSVRFEEARIDSHHLQAAIAWKRKEAVVVPIVSVERHEVASVQSLLLVPIGDGSDLIGVLSLRSAEKGFFRPEDIGRLQLLGALIDFIAQGRSRIANSYPR